jgi:hypothetical protein
MSYLFELRTIAGTAAYMVASGDNPEEALAQVHKQLAMDDDDEVAVLAVHTVH